MSVTFHLIIAEPDVAKATETFQGRPPATLTSRSFGLAPTDGSDEPLAFNESTPDDVKTPACQVLGARNMQSPVSDNDLVNCFVELRKNFQGRLSLAAKKRRALELPSVREKAFLGFVLTCYGEIDPKGNECDGGLIMLTMQNRARLCNEQDPRPASDQYTALDIAFQRKQFSAFNARIYPRYRVGAFEANPTKDGPHGRKMRRCIESFNMFAHNKYPDFNPSAPQDPNSALGLPAVEGTNLVTSQNARQTPDPAKQKKLQSQLVHYFAKYLVTKHKAPRWKEWSTISDVTCQTAHGRETASNAHLVFADGWDCKGFLKKDKSIPLPPPRPDFAAEETVKQ